MRAKSALGTLLFIVDWSSLRIGRGTGNRFFWLTHSQSGGFRLLYGTDAHADVAELADALDSGSSGR